MADGTLFGEPTLLSGLFSNLWDEPQPGSLVPRPRGIDPALLQAIGFRRLGRASEDLPYWTRPPGIYPDVDPRMQMFLPPPDTFYSMPIYRTDEAVRPRDAVPPWIDPEGGLHLDTLNPKYRRTVTPGRNT